MSQSASLCILLIHHWPSTYYVSGTMLGAGATSVNTTARDPSPRHAEHQLEKTDDPQNKQIWSVRRKKAL